MTALNMPRSPADYTYISPPLDGQRRYRRLDWFATGASMTARVSPSSVKTSTFWLNGGDHAAITACFCPPGTEPRPARKRRLHINPTIAAQGSFYDDMDTLVRRTTTELLGSETHDQEACNVPDTELLRATDAMFGAIANCTLITPPASAQKSMRSPAPRWHASTPY